MWTHAALPRGWFGRSASPPVPWRPAAMGAVRHELFAVPPQPGRLHASPPGLPPPERPGRATGAGRIGRQSGDKPHWRSIFEFGDPRTQRGDFGVRRHSSRSLCVEAALVLRAVLILIA